MDLLRDQDEAAPGLRYLRAYAALVLGYHHLHLLDDVRKKRKEWMASSSRVAVTAVKAKAKAAVATKR